MLVQEQLPHSDLVPIDFRQELDVLHPFLIFSLCCLTPRVERLELTKCGTTWAPYDEERLIFADVLPSFSPVCLLIEIPASRQIHGLAGPKSPVFCFLRYSRRAEYFHDIYSQILLHPLDLFPHPLFVAVISLLPAVAFRPADMEMLLAETPYLGD